VVAVDPGPAAVAVEVACGRRSRLRRPNIVGHRPARDPGTSQEGLEARQGSSLIGLSSEI